MPQLPSGRHVGLSQDPLARLVTDAREGKFVHRLMAITEVSHLAPFLEVLELVEIDGDNQVTVAEGSNHLPGNFRSIESGVHLDRLEVLPWPIEDIEALRTFATSPRNVSWMQQRLADVVAAKQEIAQGGEFVARLQAAWWSAGVHPAQEEGWTDEDSSVWDIYDLWAALARLHLGLASREEGLDRGAFDAFMITGATLRMLVRSLPETLSSILAADSPVREVAAVLRAASALDVLPENRREWQREQFLACAEALGNSIDGADLREIDRESANIVALAFVTT